MTTNIDSSMAGTRGGEAGVEPVATARTVPLTDAAGRVIGTAVITGDRVTAQVTDPIAARCSLPATPACSRRLDVAPPSYRAPPWRSGLVTR
jgi:hypothetical protein